MEGTAGVHVVQSSIIIYCAYGHIRFNALVMRLCLCDYELSRLVLAICEL